ncbi:MAG: cofactor-independent phosphoglycerate mutase [Armatimonadota bacterium]|jgi:2,3-bisphosphoglycerate-independent phosphoglycerate mutase
MKYIVIVPDGMSDHPLDDLDGQTPLQAADTPNMDALAQAGTVGTAMTIPEGMDPGSDVANLSLLGYDPAQYYTGRGPLEALAMDIGMDARDVAFRCNLITSDGETLVDFAAGHVPTEDARQLIALIDSKLGGRSRKFLAGVSYRHLLMWADGPMDLQTRPPHDVVGSPLEEVFPVGERDDAIRQMIWDSMEILDGHEINARRRDEGVKPANMIWPWGQGRRPEVPSLLSKYGLQGATICAVDLIKGIGKAAGMRHIAVPGATGYLDTDYGAKAEYAVAALGDHDFVYLHIEAPDEAGHLGDIEEKIRAIERIDSLVVGPVVDGLTKLGHYRLLVAPDHATPIPVRTHVADPVPFVIAPPVAGHEQRHNDEFSEAAAQATGLHVAFGHDLMGMFVE